MRSVVVLVREDPKTSRDLNKVLRIGLNRQPGN
jgi:hypothetical protein